MSSCTWIISERSDRWRRAVDSFAPAILPGGFECLALKPEEIEKGVRTLFDKRVLTPFAVVLYELPIESPRETLLSLVRCAAFDSPPLQLVAFPAELRLTGRAEWELTAALRQLGAGAVLRHPEHLWQVGRLVARYARG